MRLLEHEIELSISLNSDTYPQAPKYADAGFAACELVSRFLTMNRRT